MATWVYSSNSKLDLVMKMQIWCALLVVAGFFLLQSCGGKTKEAEEDKTLLKIETEDEDGKSSITINSDVLKTSEVVDYQELKELLPDKVLGIKRSHLEGQKSGMSGFKIATASGKYEADGKQVEIAIVDAGGSSLVLAGLAMWTNTEFEKESDEGYERTTEIDGHKAFEQYDKNSRSGQVSVLVKDRFLVNVEGDNIDENDLRKVLNEINLRRLSRLE